MSQVSSNFENIQILAVLHGFIRASLFPIYTNMQLLLHLANLPYTFFGPDQRLGQVWSNSKNVQNIAILHGFIKQVCFPFIQTCSYYYA